MLEEFEHSRDILLYSQAAENRGFLRQISQTAKRTLIEDHMEHCIGDGVADGGKSAKAALAEFKALARYL